MLTDWWLTKLTLCINLPTYGFKPSPLNEFTVRANTRPQLLIFHSTIPLPSQKIPLSKFLMTSLHVICGLGPAQSKILATPMREFNFFYTFFELCHGPKTGGHGTISPLSVLLTVHALAEFCDHINLKLHHSKLEYNQDRSQTGCSAGLNVFVFSFTEIQ